MTTSFFTGKIIETATGDLRTQWYNVCRQDFWYMDPKDLLDYYDIYMPERPAHAEPYRQAITEIGRHSDNYDHLIDYVSPK